MFRSHTQRAIHIAISVSSVSLPPTSFVLPCYFLCLIHRASLSLTDALVLFIAHLLDANGGKGDYGIQVTGGTQNSGKNKVTQKCESRRKRPRFFPALGS